MKKVLSVLFMAAALAVMFCLAAYAEADERLADLQGSYVELFPEFAKEEQHDYWIECISQYVDDPEMAEMYYAMMIASCMGDLKGQEAIEAFSADPEATQFNCFFTDGIVKFTIEDDVISGYDADGNTVFSHAYTYVGDEPIVVGGQTFEGMNMHIYQADTEGDAFTYFAFADDTPAETFHLEFRYGAATEQISDFYDGDYAYWLAAAISENYAESSMMQDCIKLFVDENLGAEAEMAEEEVPAAAE